MLEREDYRYSGSENEEEEHQVAGEPSSIINQAQGGDTLRRNFQQIQVSEAEWSYKEMIKTSSH